MQYHGYLGSFPYRFINMNKCHHMWYYLEIKAEWTRHRSIQMLTYGQPMVGLHQYGTVIVLQTNGQTDATKYIISLLC